ncbi:MAG: thioredoxin family protein [Balneolaceae bacterium]|nr:thioredoxin family protein [Balneolaceae bacterium]
MSIDIKILQSNCCGPQAPIKERIEQAAAIAGVDVAIEQPADLQEIMKFGTMTFPSIVVNGTVYPYSDYQDLNELVRLLKTEIGEQL